MLLQTSSDVNEFQWVISTAISNHKSYITAEMNGSYVRETIKQGFVLQTLSFKPLLLYTQERSHIAVMFVIRSSPWWRTRNDTCWHTPVRVCLHVPTPCPSPSESPSKFIIMPIVMGTLTGRMASTPILPINHLCNVKLWRWLWRWRTRRRNV